MVHVLCRLLLGVVLIAAAVGKAYQAASDPLASRALFGSRWLVLVAILVELYGGLWLVSGHLGKWARTALVLVFLALAGVACVLGFAGRSSCGCFGAIDVPISPWLAVAFDLSAAVFVWRSAQSRHRQGLDGSRRQTGIVRFFAVTAIWLIIGMPVTYAVATASSARLNAQGVITGDGGVTVEPEAWLGKPFPLSRFLTTSETLAQGRWVVVFVRTDCHRCSEISSAIAELLRSGSDRRGLLVNVECRGAVGFVPVG